MKNQIRRIALFSYIFVVPFLITLIFPSQADAISGSCSYHGGVACSLGSDYDGSVICNDGWRDSSVSFSDAQECKVSQFTCPIPSGSKSDCGSLRAQLGRSGNLGTPFGDNELAQCEAQNTQYDNAQTAYQQCLSSQASIQTQQFNTYVQSSQQQENDWQAQEQTKYDVYCESSQGIGSKWVGDFGPSGSCKPNKSDFWKSCQQKMGTNATYDKASGYCTCYSGYVVDSNNQCVLEQEQVIPIQDVSVKTTVNPPVQKPIVSKKVIIKPIATSTDVQEATTTTPKVVVDIPVTQPTEHIGWFTSLFQKIGGLFTSLFH